MAGKAYVVTAVSNEAPFLLEWVAHYRGLGFDGAILFTHDCSDGTDAIVARLAEMGHAQHVVLTLKPKQDPLRQAMRNLPAIARTLGAEWCLAAHVDEFLQIRCGDGTLGSLLTECGSADAISVCRRAFGSSGYRGVPDGLIRETHRRAAHEGDMGAMITKGIKTLFRMDRVSRIAPHRPYFEDSTGPVTWLDGGGKAMPEAYLSGQWTAHDGFSHDLARLNYYAVPSPETVLIRNGVPEDKAARKIFKTDWGKQDRNDVAEDGMARSVALSAPVLKTLYGDDLLQGLMRKGRAWHLETAQAALQSDADLAVLCDKLSNGGAQRGLHPPYEEGQKTAVRTSPRGGGGTYMPPPVRPIRFDLAPSPTGETRAVLHGGFHKTATTYLQRLLEDNDAYLGRQSVYMVPHLKLRKHITFPSQLDAYKHLKIRRRTRYSEEELQGFSDAFFAEPLSLRPARMILSDENITGLPSHCVTTGKLYRYRKEFFRCFAKRIPVPITDAFFAVRNYADFFASSYIEYLRAATTTTSEQLITPELMRRNLFATLPDWQNVFDDFAQAFPDTRIHVWRFEDFRALTPSILSTLCGENVDVSKFKPPKERNARPSASARAVEELVLISETQGAAAMAEHAKSVQDMYPQGTDHERFDPWSPAERAHLTRLYDKDWEAMCRNPNLMTLNPT